MSSQTIWRVIVPETINDNGCFGSAYIAALDAMVAAETFRAVVDAHMALRVATEIDRVTRAGENRPLIYCEAGAREHVREREKASD